MKTHKNAKAINLKHFLRANQYLLLVDIYVAYTPTVDLSWLIMIVGHGLQDVFVIQGVT